MCRVNDEKRSAWQARINELNAEKDIYVEKQNTIDSCCSTLDCISEKAASLGAACANIDTGGIIDGGKGSYYSSSFATLSSELTQEKDAYQKAIDVIDMNIRTVQNSIDNLPANCGSCSECCPPVVSTGSATKTSGNA